MGDVEGAERGCKVVNREDAGGSGGLGFVAFAEEAVESVVAGLEC